MDRENGTYRGEFTKVLGYTVEDLRNIPSDFLHPPEIQSASMRLLAAAEKRPLSAMDGMDDDDDDEAPRKRARLAGAEAPTARDVAGRGMLPTPWSQEETSALDELAHTEVGPRSDPPGGASAH